MRAKTVSEQNEIIRRKIANALAQNRLDAAKKLLDGLIEEKEKRVFTGHAVPLHRRTRFFASLAKETGCVRLAALVYLAVVKSVKLPPHVRRWHAKAEWWGKQVGLSRAGVLRHFNPNVYNRDPQKREAKLAFRKAKLVILSKWVKATPTHRGLLLRPTRAAYAEYKKAQQDGEQSRHGRVGFFCPSLARLLGMNGSIIYRLMKTPDADGNRRRLGALGIAKRLPWIGIEAARIELTRLYQIGLLQRHEGCIWRGYIYYFRRRTAKDRAKFQQ
jgi:hypothetical protein